MTVVIINPNSSDVMTASALEAARHASVDGWPAMLSLLRGPLKKDHFGVIVYLSSIFSSLFKSVAEDGARNAFRMAGMNMDSVPIPNC